MNYSNELQKNDEDLGSLMKGLIRSRYKDYYGKPFEASDGQALIFETIATRGANVGSRRIHCMAYTQYGKSDIVGQAVLTRITTYPEKFAIVAPSNKKAHIIMSYVIQHIFDNEICMAMFDIPKGESMEHIRRERSKDRLTFRHPNGQLGEVFIISTEGKRTKDVLDALLGFGAPNVIIDESSLVDDPQYSGIKRMLGGHVDNYLFEIGNPMRRNHFLRTSKDPKYYHINIDYHQGILEGRITKDYIEEMRVEAFFEQLYENKFPEADMVDEQGYTPLLSEKEIVEVETKGFGQKRLGVDVAEGGGDWNKFVIRDEGTAKVVLQYQSENTMLIPGRVILIAEEYGIDERNIFIDAIGIGKGVVDRLRELGWNVNGVKVSEQADDPMKFANRRAENYWRVRDWAKAGGTFAPHKDWKPQLTSTKYTADSAGKVIIMPKKIMKKILRVSPDTIEAGMLTFDRVKSIKPKTERQQERAILDQFDSKKEKRYRKLLTGSRRLR